MPGRKEKVAVKTAVPIVAIFTQYEVWVKHTNLIGRDFNSTIELRPVGESTLEQFQLERSPLLNAAGRRLSHYLDMLFALILGLAILVFGMWMFGLFMDYVGIPLFDAVGVIVGNVSAGVLSSRSASVLVGVALFAVAVVGIGFLLAIGWKLADKVRKKS